MSVFASDPLAHPGPWTEEDFLELPVDRRIELLDGSLLVSPAGSHLHQLLSSRLWAVLDRSAPPGYRVLEAVNVRVAPGRILIPDVAVIANADMSATVSDAEKVRLVVEVTSPSNAYVDRGVKPPLYGAAGITHYLRIELAGSEAVAFVFELEGDGYVQRAQVPHGQETVLTAPFPVRFDLAALIAGDQT